MDFYISTRQTERNQHMACQAIHQYILESSIWSVRVTKVKLVLYESIMFTVEHLFINPFVLHTTDC